METVIALLTALAGLIPEVEAAMPTLQDLLGGKTVSAAEMVTVWQAIAALEAQVAAKAAQIEGTTVTG